MLDFLPTDPVDIVLSDKAESVERRPSCSPMGSSSSAASRDNRPFFGMVARRRESGEGNTEKRADRRERGEVNERVEVERGREE